MAGAERQRDGGEKRRHNKRKAEKTNKAKRAVTQKQKTKKSDATEEGEILPYIILL